MKKDLRASRSKQIAIGVVALLTAILAACSNAAAPSVTTPESSVDPAVEQALAKAKAISGSLPQSFIAQGVLRDRPLSAPVIVSRVITSNGGTIDIPSADFQLQIPKGAIKDSMTIEVTALAGSVVAYDFEPRGATFAAPLKFVQRLAHTNLRATARANDSEPEVGGAIFADPSMFDDVTGIGVGTEHVPAEVHGSVNGNLLSFMIWNFSGYMASTGRR